MKKLILYFGFILVAFSCTEKIEVTLQPNFDRLVVDGKISTDTGACIVNLTHTADYFYNAPVPRVTNAMVTMSNGDTTISLMETIPGSSGIYKTTSSFHGEIGKTYHLNVQLFNAIGGYSSYQASSLLRHVARLDSTKVLFDPNRGKKGIWEVAVYAKEPGDEVNYYMFNLYRNGKLWSDSLNKVTVANDQFINGSYIMGLRVFYINNAHPW
ncbi:MAG: DUF4249 family protein, partial [Bacteroidota bacterium]